MSQSISPLLQVKAQASLDDAWVDALSAQEGLTDEMLVVQAKSKARMPRTKAAAAPTSIAATPAGPVVQPPIPANFFPAAGMPPPQPPPPRAARGPLASAAAVAFSDRAVAAPKASSLGSVPKASGVAVEAASHATPVVTVEGASVAHPPAASTSLDAGPVTAPPPPSPAAAPSGHDHSDGPLPFVPGEHGVVVGDGDEDGAPSMEPVGENASLGDVATNGHGGADRGEAEAEPTAGVTWHVLKFLQAGVTDH